MSTFHFSPYRLPKKPTDGMRGEDCMTVFARSISSAAVKSEVRDWTQCSWTGGKRSEGGAGGAGGAGCSMVKGCVVLAVSFSQGGR